MHTNIVAPYKDRPEGLRATQILQKCVHCGFCSATCPTYLTLGNELDSPRGRIYLIKQMLEGQSVGAQTQTHLDRCLTCRACETTCPSGVDYAELAQIGRRLVDEQVPRAWWPRAQRRALRFFLPSRRINPLYRLAQLLRPLLPKRLKSEVLVRRAPGDWPTPRHTRRVLIPAGCVQPTMSPNIDAACARVLDHLGISAIAVPQSQCCGAMELHMQAHDAALARIRHNVDTWWPLINDGADAIVITASGCGASVRDYGRLLAAEPDYAERAAKISACTVDPVELIEAQDLSALGTLKSQEPIAFQPPCTLQHALKLSERIEPVLRRLGYQLLPLADKHLCCGSAGTYSVLQPEMAKKLRQDKLDALKPQHARVIASANIGCIHHLQAATDTPVRHWLEVLDEDLLNR